MHRYHIRVFTVSGWCVLRYARRKKSGRLMNRRRRERGAGLNHISSTVKISIYDWTYSL